MENRLASLRQMAEIKTAIGFSVISLDLFFAIFTAVLASNGRDHLTVVLYDKPSAGCLLQVIDWQEGEKSLRFNCHTHHLLKEELASRNILWTI